MVRQMADLLAYGRLIFLDLLTACPARNEASANATALAAAKHALRFPHLGCAS